MGLLQTRLGNTMSRTKYQWKNEKKYIKFKTKLKANIKYHNKRIIKK